MGDIDSCMLFVKPGKSAGSCGYSSDHIIHGSYLLRSHITSLFNVMISHGFAPIDFRLSTLIPIPKNKRKSRNDSDNYWAIALSSILGKMLDHLLLVKYHCEQSAQWCMEVQRSFAREVQRAFGMSSGIGFFLLIFTY